MNTTAVSLVRTLLALLVTLFAAVPMAHAQDTGESINVAVLNLEGEGVDQKLLETLTSVLRNEAQQYSDYDIVNQSPINLSEIVVVLGCDTNNPTCLKQAADQLEARVLIYGRVEKVEQAHTVTIEVFDADTSKVEQRLVRTIVNKDDPVIAFRKQIQSMFAPDQATEGTRLQIGSNVEGAEVRVNDTMIGNAPVERKGLPPGNYSVEVSQEGYDTWKVSIELTEGADIRLWAPLNETKQPEAVAQKEAGEGTQEGDTGVKVDDSSGLGDSSGMGDSSKPPVTGGGGGPNWGAWSAIGVGGVALAGSGAMALLMKGQEDELADHDAQRFQMSRDAYISDRQEIIDTGESYELAHRVLLGVGAVSVVAGTVWLFVDGAEADDPLADERNWDVSVSPRGVSALFSW
ncbi:PEGA domain-containing protein [Persicimonas caeni]|nr:PEGA domain-containing protein [Persicimonas caeni]